MRPRFHVRLVITDQNCRPDEITRSTGISPSRSWQKGDRKGKTLLVEKENGWLLNSSLPADSPFTDHIRCLLDVIEPVEDQFRAFTEKWDSSIACALYIDDETPELYFEKWILKRIAALNLSFDLDLYCLGEEDNEIAVAREPSNN